MEEKLKAIGFSIGAFISWVVGGLGIVFTALLGMMVLDYITGLLVARARGEISSSIGRNGLIRKFYIIILIGAIYLLEAVSKTYTGQEFGVLQYTGDGAAVAYLIIEFISLVENGIKLNIWMPGIIKKGVKVYKESL